MAIKQNEELINDKLVALGTKMKNNLITKNTPNIPDNNNLNILADKILDVPSREIHTEEWIRPTDRPTVPIITENEDVMYLLFGVNENSPNDYAIQIDTTVGNYIIDWGDGLTETINKDIKCEHIYDFNSINLPISSEGYKWIWIKIYAETGKLKSIKFNVRHSLRTIGSNSNTFIPQIFEIYIQGSSIDNFDFSSNVYTKMMLLNIFEFYKTNKIIILSYFLHSCTNLKKLKIDTSNAISLSDFLYNCSSFNQELNLDLTKCTSLNYFLENCTSFNNKLILNTNEVKSFNGFLVGCKSFNQELNINTSKSTNISDFLSNCNSLNQPLNLDLNSLSTKLNAGFIGINNYCLKYLRLKNMGTINDTLRISNSSLNEQSLQLLFTDLCDRTGIAAGTITITNCYGTARLTDEQKAIAIIKNWTIVS